MPRRVFFQHGWGFDSNCWAGWSKFFPSDTIFSYGERGYWGAQSANYPKQERLITVAHSFGLHLLPSDILNSTDTLVLISAFRAFPPGRHKVLTRMGKKLDCAPAEVLLDFYNQAYGPIDGSGASSSDISNLHFVRRCMDSKWLAWLDIKRLKEDLEAMPSLQFDLASVKNISSIILLHGKRDQIIDANLSEELSSNLPNSALILHPSSGHALPLTDAEWCCKQILAKIDKPSAGVFSGNRSFDSQSQTETIRDEAISKTDLAREGSQSQTPFATDEYQSQTALTRNTSLNAMRVPFSEQSTFNDDDYGPLAKKFAQASSTYDPAAQAQARCAQQLGERFARLLPRLPAGPLLEIGCGTGLLTRQLLPLLGEERSAIITDLSPTMLKLCINNMVQLAATWERKVSFDQISFEQLDANSLSWGNLRFSGGKLNFLDFAPSQSSVTTRLKHDKDCPQFSHPIASTGPEVSDGRLACIVSSFALQWLSCPDQCVRSLYNSLLPEGLLLLAVPTQGSFIQWKTACRLAGVPFSGNSLPEAGSLRALARALSAESHVEFLKFDTHYKNATDFFRSLKLAGVDLKIDAEPQALSKNTRNLRLAIRAWDKEQPDGVTSTYEVAVMTIPKAMVINPVKVVTEEANISDYE